MGWASQASQERVGICVQDGGQGENVEQGNIALSAFHRADVGAVQSSLMCQSLLGQARLPTGRPEAVAELAEKIMITGHLFNFVP